MTREEMNKIVELFDEFSTKLDKEFVSIYKNLVMKTQGSIGTAAFLCLRLSSLNDDFGTKLRMIQEEVNPANSDAESESIPEIKNH